MGLGIGIGFRNPGCTPVGDADGTQAIGRDVGVERIDDRTDRHARVVAVQKVEIDGLDAKAFQQEETATHALTSGLVILNGVVVGLIAVGMFGMLVMLLRHTLANT